MSTSDITFISGGVTASAGFTAGAARGGLKTEGDDVLLIAPDAAATVGAVFTRNAVKAAPLLVCAEHAARGAARAIIANSGCANCCTGEQGWLDARRMCEAAAAKIGCEPSEVLVCSTGLIGLKLEVEKVETALDKIALSSGPASDEAVARAFMTTDTRPKFCAAQATIGGRVVTVGGQVKGAGMIGPDMGPVPAGSTSAPLHATLLVFLTTDARVANPLLQTMLEHAVDRSFNSLTIDGDTSTNDTCLLLAGGASAVEITQENRDEFQALLKAVCVHLAQRVVLDGEGANKLITVRVEGAASERDARKIAMTVANSPLVKTAVFGEDPNWGRIAAAAGRAGVLFEPRRLGIFLDEVEVFRDGEPAAFSLPAAEAVMQQDELTIRVTLGEGAATWTAWSCDFSYDYVKINAEYHT